MSGPTLSPVSSLCYEVIKRMLHSIFAMGLEGVNVADITKLKLYTTVGAAQCDLFGLTKSKFYFINIRKS